MPEFRNRIAMNPLLRKGGVHQRGRTSERQNSRSGLNAELDDWYADTTEPAAAEGSGHQPTESGNIARD